MKAQFPGKVWDGTSVTDTNILDDKSPDYATHDQVMLEIIATQEIVLSHIALVEPLQNPGVAKSILMVDDDGIGFKYRKLKAGTNVSITYSDTEITITSSGAGGVGGDADTLDGLDSTDFSLVGHTHVISQITGLQTALDGKSDVGHGHAISDITGLQTALDGKSATGHTHTVSEITDFTTSVQTIIDGGAYLKADGSVQLTTDWNVGGAAITATRFTSVQPDGVSPFVVDSTTVVTNLNADLLDGNHAAAFALASHTHTISNITDLQTALDSKIARGDLHKCVISRTTTQTVPVSTSTKILFGTTVLNVGGLADIANSQIVIQRTGTYLVYGSGYFTLGVNNIQLDIRAGGVSVGGIVHTDAADVFLLGTVARVVSLTAGDVVDMVIQHNNSGAASRDTVTAGRSPVLGVVELA